MTHQTELDLMMTLRRTVRVLSCGIVCCGSIYFGPFLPSPTVWPHGIRNFFISPRRNQRIGSSSQPTPSPIALSALKLSVIVPVFNEGAAAVRASLEEIDRRTLEPKSTEIVLVDGGCTDDSMDAVSQVNLRSELRLTSSEGGRGPAMLAGTQASNGDILLLLHADTGLVDGYDNILREAFAGDEDLLLTTFEFDVNLDDQEYEEDFVRKINNLERFTNIRARRLWLPYGDQAMAIRSTTLAELGGIKPLKMMEDFDLITRVRHFALKNRKRIEILPYPATTSARRFHRKGAYKTSFLNWTFAAGYKYLGLSPETIFELYYGGKGPRSKL